MGVYIHEYTVRLGDEVGLMIWVFLSRIWLELDCQWLVGLVMLEGGMFLTLEFEEDLQLDFLYLPVQYP